MDGEELFACRTVTNVCWMDFFDQSWGHGRCAWWLVYGGYELGFATVYGSKNKDGGEGCEGGKQQWWKSEGGGFFCGFSPGFCMSV